MAASPHPYFNVRDFGATGDGHTLDTQAIQAAVDACAAQGGGEVVLPPGRYLSGTICLASHVTFRILTGATLLGSPNLADYKPRGLEPDSDLSVYHLIRAENAEHITLTGGGTIDGQGDAFWDHKLGPKTPDFRGYPLPKRKSGRPSPMINLLDCTHVRVENLQIQNAAGWNLHPANCRWVWIQGITIFNPMTGPNTDGIDIDGCQDVMVVNCHVETGDDAICLKTEAHGQACERIVISNCILASRTCGVKLGTGSHQAYRQIAVSNCVVYRSERAFGIYAFDGGAVEDVQVNGIVVETGGTIPNFADRPIHIDVRRRTPESPLSRVRGIQLSNFLVRGPGRILVTAPDEAPIENLRLENICLEVTGPQDLATFTNPSPSPMQFSKDYPHLRAAPAHLIIRGVNRLRLRNVEVMDCCPSGLGEMDGLLLENVHDADIQDFRTYPLLEGRRLVVKR